MNFNEIKDHLKNKTYKWLVTGGAGFIGSHLVEFLYNHNQDIVVLDNLSTGYKKNIEPFLDKIQFIEGSIEDLELCHQACNGIDYVLHQAALGSVPRSISDPLATHGSNVDGFVNILIAARDAKVKSFVYASSSSVYGDDPNLPKVEDQIGNCLSPYAVSKRVNELYAAVFSKNYNMKTLGIRYFNVFGPRQDPNGPYAAVIPLWIKALLNNETVYINGDGETSRDFCYVENVVQMNIISSFNISERSAGDAFNCALGDRLSLNNLLKNLIDSLSIKNPNIIFRDFRDGDVRHSQASISKAKMILDFVPKIESLEGINKTCEYFKKFYIENEKT